MKFGLSVCIFDSTFVVEGWRCQDSFFIAQSLPSIKEGEHKGRVDGGVNGLISSVRRENQGMTVRLTRCRTKERAEQRAKSNLEGQNLRRRKEGFNWLRQETG